MTDQRPEVRPQDHSRPLAYCVDTTVSAHTRRGDLGDDRCGDDLEQLVVSDPVTRDELTGLKWAEHGAARVSRLSLPPSSMRSWSRS
jgi:hypothetical protein